MDTFSEEEARLILNLTLREGAVDFIAWHFDPRGLHSVRNAYKLYMQRNMHITGTDASTSMQQAEVLGGSGRRSGGVYGSWHALTK